MIAIYRDNGNGNDSMCNTVDDGDDDNDNEKWTADNNNNNNADAYYYKKNQIETYLCDDATTTDVCIKLLDDWPTKAFYMYSFPVYNLFFI